MKLLKSRESGQTMVIALILLAVGSLLVVPMLNQSFTNLGYHQSIECRTLTSYSADAGMEYVLCKLYNAPGAYTDPDNPLQESLTLNDRTVNVFAGYTGGGIYKITSVASGGGCGSTTIEAYVNLSAGSFAFAVASKTQMTITSNTMVATTDPKGANIHSNGDISLESGTTIEGNAYAVGTINVASSTVWTVTPDSPPVNFPGDYSELYKTMAQEIGSYTPPSGTLTLDGGTPENPIIFPSDTTYPYAYIQGNLTIWTNSYVRLTSTIYVTGTIEMKPGSRLDGTENILAEGDIDITGGGYTSTLIPVLISKDGNIDCKGPGQIINAVVYAPNGTVTLQAGIQFYGAVGGNIVNITNSTVTYAAELQGRQDLPGGELTTISYIYK